MNTLICAGGSATRILEAVVHLCAAGLGPERLRVLQIDPDQSNGNGSRVRGLLETYAALHGAFAGRLGPHKLFATQIEDLGSWSPCAPGDTLAKVLRFDVLDKDARDVARLLFTEGERELTLDQGFRGHTPIGAAAMSLVARERHREPWDGLITRLRQDLDAAGARVLIAASVFGGTGASAIHPLARFLRSVPERNESQLKIGVAALVPYFRFKPSGARVDLAARSEDFALATKAAVQYYQHLRDNKDWDFDAMYWIGDSAAREVPYAPGGPEQRNPAHFVDLLGALATLEFYLQPQGGKACYWSGPRRDVEPQLDENLLEWQDLPLRHLDRKVVKRSLFRLCLCGAAHAGFYQELLRSEELHRAPHLLPWYFRYFRGAGSLAGGKERDVVERLGDFFTSYHLPFWGQVADSPKVRLFNREAMPQAPGSERRRVDLARLHNLLWPDQGAPGDLDAMDDFFSEMIDVGRPRGAGGAAAYLSLLASAADAYTARRGGA